MGTAAAAGGEGVQDFAGRQMWSGWMQWVGALGFLPGTGLFMSLTVQPSCRSHWHQHPPVSELRTHICACCKKNHQPCLTSPMRHPSSLLGSTVCMDSALPLGCLQVLKLKCLHWAEAVRRQGKVGLCFSRIQL